MPDYSHIVRQMLNMLDKPSVIIPQYEKVKARGIRKLLETLHIARPRYIPIKKPHNSETIKVIRYSRLKLPD